MMNGRTMPYVVGVLLAIDAALLLAYVSNYFVGQPFYKLTALLDLNGERSICVWYSSLKLFLVAALAGLHATRHFGARDLGSWLVAGFALVLLLLSMDEIVQIHEWIGRQTDALLPNADRTATFFQHTGIWTLLVGVPFAAAFAALLLAIKAKLALEPGCFAKIVTGMALFFLGALGFETISNAFDDMLSLGYVILVCLEEGCEMLGATRVFWGLYGLTAHAIVVDFSGQTPGAPAAISSLPSSK